MHTPLPYTPEESEKASDEWKASCGHHSIAAACNVSLDQVKQACPKLTGWMSPTMISQTLEALRQHPRKYPVPSIMKQPPDHVIAIMRVQWEGPWLNPGVPKTAAYQHTHYIAIRAGGWVVDPAIDANEQFPWQQWLPLITDYAKTLHRCTGWHFTHAWLPFERD